MRKIEPWYYYADCVDPDYSCLFNNKADAQTEVNDHGGSIVKLYIEGDVQSLQKEIKDLKQKLKEALEIK